MKPLIAVGFLAAVAALLIFAVPDSDAGSDDCEIRYSGVLPVQANLVFADGPEEHSVKLSKTLSKIMLEPKEYKVSVRSPEGLEYYSTIMEIDDSKTLKFIAAKFSTSETGWKYGEDYSVQYIINHGTVNTVPVSETQSGITIVTCVDDNAGIWAVPSADKSVSGYSPVYKTFTIKSGTSSYRFRIPPAQDFVLTVPAGSEVMLGMEALEKKDLQQISPVSCDTDGTVTVIVYKLIIGNTYGIRVTGETFADYCCVMKMKAGLKAEITEEFLNSHSKTQMTDSKSSMLLNINPEGFLRLNVGDTYEIRPERIYFDENQDKYSNYFVPKYRYKAINFGGSNSSVVSFDGDLMRADKEGTAVVLVTYEAVYSDYLNIQGMNGRMLGACLPEDTGVFVVTAGPSAGPDINVTVKGNLTSDRSAGNHFDSDLDYVYYSDELVGGTMTLSNNSGKFTQYNPVYKNGILKSFKDTSANDGRSVKMTSYNGPNIVACTLNGLTSYQVIKAAGVNISVRDLDIPSDNYVIAGDRISVKVTGLNSLLTSRFYNSDKVVVMKVFGEEYVSDPEGSFGIITVPDSYTSGTMKPVFYLRASGNCQEFGSHRGTETPVAERTADFGFFVIHTIFQHDSRIINLDSMIEPDSGSVISAESGLQGKTVDLGTIEIPAGKKIFIEIDRKSPQKFYGIKSLSGAGAWLTEDSGKSGRDCIVLSAEPSAEDTGEYPIKIVINLKNTKGTMKTSVTATLKVVDSFRIQSLKYVSYDGILLPTVPESVHIPDDQAFRGWNTASDGSGTEYKAGTNVRLDNGITLYAQYGAPEEGSAFTFEGLRYRITSMEQGKETAVLIGRSNSFSGDLVLPETAVLHGTNYKVTGVAGMAFKGESVITSADFSNAETIGYSVFAYSSGLKSVIISGNVSGWSFKRSADITTIVIHPDSVLSDYVFGYCKKIESISIGENTSLANTVFYKNSFRSVTGAEMERSQISGYNFAGKNCILAVCPPETGTVFDYSGLKYRVTSPDTAEVCGYTDVNGTVSIPNKVKFAGFTFSVNRIAAKAFYKCTKLTSVDFGSVKSIGIRAFANCTSLSSVDTGSIEEIGQYAFYGCKSLKTVKIGKGTDVGQYAFQKCTGLKEVTFGKIGSIAVNSFYGCAFFDGNKKLQVTADNMAGHRFEGKYTHLSML